MKIISLQSIGLGRLNPEYRSMPVNEELFAKVGSPNPFIGSEKVVSIELATGDYVPTIRSLVTYDNHTYYYKVTTSDGHIRVLPEQSYIAEWAEDGDSDDSRI